MVGDGYDGDQEQTKTIIKERNSGVWASTTTIIYNAQLID